MAITRNLSMKQKGFAPIIIIVLVAIVASGVYFLGTKNILKLPTSFSLPTISPSPTPTPDPTANWKTYTNYEYGYSVKYPSDWKVIEAKPSNTPNWPYDISQENQLQKVN